MHRFMRAIGFSKELTRHEQTKMIKKCIKDAEHKNYTSVDGDNLIAEYCKDFADEFGVCVRGEMDEADVFHYDYYFPYLKSNKESTNEEICIERQAEKMAFSGICDEIRLGVSLIFYLQNEIPYLKLKYSGRLPMNSSSMNLTGLSLGGKILMPIYKKPSEEKMVKKKTYERNLLLARARKGDEQAIENLTMDDMDTYSLVARKIMKEDLYSIVDTCFMPFGLESDQYAVIAEITDYKITENNLTKEEVVIMSLICNDLPFDVCINRKDLIGEPEIGRRFKGNLWMQGYVNYPE